MKTNIVFFEDAKDLESLTGLSYDELWDKGFDLDDMDWGFVSDENYITETEDEFGDISMEIKYDIPQFAYQILSMMESYCVAFIMWNIITSIITLYITLERKKICGL